MICTKSNLLEKGHGGKEPLLRKKSTSTSVNVLETSIPISILGSLEGRKVIAGITGITPIDIGHLNPRSSK